MMNLHDPKERAALARDLDELQKDAKVPLSARISALEAKIALLKIDSELRVVEAREAEYQAYLKRREKNPYEPFPSFMLPKLPGQGGIP